MYASRHQLGRDGVCAATNTNTYAITPSTRVMSVVCDRARRAQLLLNCWE